MSEYVRWHKSFSIVALGHRLLSMPMLVVLIPLVVGIALTQYYTLPPFVAEIAICLLLVAAWFFDNRIASWGYTALALILLGYILVEYRSPRASVPYDSVVEMDVDVVGLPAERNGYSVAEGKVVRWREDGAWRRADDKVQLWLRTDTIGVGDRVVVWGELRERMSRNVEYNTLLRNRGYVGGVGISDINIIEINHSARTTLHQRAVAKLEGYDLDSMTLATVEAMVVGERHAMPKVLRDAYSETGLSHLLAVSGLHLGIVFMVVLLVVAPLRLIHRGHRVVNIVVIVAIWLFAVMSGLSPSVVRAAIMLTMLQIAQFSSAVSNSTNILAFTLFAMLVYRPSYLYDISFQLSALAVMGILLWGQPLLRSIKVRSKILRVVVSTLVIGSVATLWTLPMVSHTFGSLPIAGVIITPVVMLFAYLIVGCGLFALIVPNPISLPFVSVCEYSAYLQNEVVLWSAEHGLTGFKYEMTDVGVALCYTLFAIITISIWSINRKKVVSLSKYVDDI